MDEQLIFPSASFPFAIAPKNVRFSLNLRRLGSVTTLKLKDLAKAKDA